MRALVWELNLIAVGMGVSGMGLRLLGFAGIGMTLAIAGIVCSAAIFSWLLVKSHPGGEDA